jgi:hypothetical protein
MVEEQRDPEKRKPLTYFRRSILEVGFIIFLFYSNLLMGEFDHSGLGQKNGLFWALKDIFTLPNFTIAIIFALLGYLILEFFRKRL